MTVAICPRHHRESPAWTRPWGGVSAAVGGTPGSSDPVAPGQARVGVGASRRPNPPPLAASAPSLPGTLAPTRRALPGGEGPSVLGWGSSGTVGLTSGPDLARSRPRPRQINAEWPQPPSPTRGWQRGGLYPRTPTPAPAGASAWRRAGQAPRRTGTGPRRCRAVWGLPPLESISTHLARAPRVPAQGAPRPSRPAPRTLQRTLQTQTVGRGGRGCADIKAPLLPPGSGRGCILPAPPAPRPPFPTRAPPPQLSPAFGG